MKTHEIVEGIEGTWHYHLAHTGYQFKALCGARTMGCNLPIEAWGTVTHLKERYCDKCLILYRKERENEDRKKGMDREDI